MKKPLSRNDVLIRQHNAEKRRERVMRLKATGHKKEDGSKNKTSKYRGKYNPRGGKEIIKLPERFNLDDNYEAVIDRIDKVAKCIKKKTHFFIDFDKIKNIDASAALMLAAELYIYNLVRRGERLRAYDSKWDKNVRKRLEEMGFLKLLKVKSEMKRIFTNEKEQEIFINFASGYESYNDGLIVYKFIGNMKSALTKGEISEELSLYLHAGMSEAINNTVEHAYGNEKEEKQNRWWVSASVNHHTQEVKVICYDRGLTIANTIRDSAYKLNIIEKLFSDKDHEIIKAALQKPRSSTGKSNRGKGLSSSLIQCIKNNKQGVLKVYSGEGMVKYEKLQKHDNGSYVAKRLLPKMRGTLIEWSVILN